MCCNEADSWRFAFATANFVRNAGLAVSADKRDLGISIENVICSTCQKVLEPHDPGSRSHRSVLPEAKSCSMKRS